MDLRSSEDRSCFRHDIETELLSSRPNAGVETQQRNVGNCGSADHCTRKVQGIEGSNRFAGKREAGLSSGPR